MGEIYHIPSVLSTGMVNTSVQRFGEKLRTLRKRHGMTLIETAAALGYNAHAFISMLETGKKQPTGELVLKVARLFNVTTDQLLKDELELDEVGGATAGADGALRET